MRNYLAAIVFLTVLGFTFSSQSQVFTVNDSGGPTYLYVLSGTSGKMEGESLTMSGMPSVIYFADRPSRIAGHMSVTDFTELWNASSDSFKADPPNAVLSIMDSDKANNYVVELMDAEAKDSTVKFKIRVLKGAPPDSFSTASLFVDMHFGPEPND